MALRQADLHPDVVVVDLPVRPVGPVRRERGGRDAGRARSRRRGAGPGLLAAAIVAAGMVGGLAVATGAPAARSASSAPASVPGAPETVVVRPGGTLWAVAERYAAEATDPRAYVDALIARNGIQGTLQPGTRLRLP